LADPLRRFHPRVRDWFRETIGAPSAPQRQGWPVIARGDHTLILAPTGTGKTFAAFLWELNALIAEGLDAPLGNSVHLLYVSPLKALNNDIQRNLETPLEALRQRFTDAGEEFPEIRVAVRTGDTPARERARMLRKTPHVLITTPESLHIMLTTVRGRGMFSGVRAVIVDEIHAIAGTKRGAHLALTLERLEQLCARPPQRIGLSATQKPLDEIAKFLGGCHPERSEGSAVRTADSSLPLGMTYRPVTIVDCGLVKKTEIAVRAAVPDLGRVGGSIWPAVAPLVLDVIRANRTTIVFVNNRAQAEKMAARVNALAHEEIALPYHGSLSRERRLTLERSLKAGQVRALVSTSALELGIDIGTVDTVVQLQSPKRVSSGLQRVGRAGHSLAAVSRGLFVPTFRDDGMEMLAIVRAMAEGDVEPTRVVQNALDVLAQVLVAATAVEDSTSEQLFALVRRAYPYHRLSRDAFDEVLAMLAGKYPSDVSAELDARVVWDRATDRVTATRASRLVAVVNGGTIPDRGLYTVNLPDRTRLGELDEEFVHETRVGDVFQLGSSTWRVQTIEHDRVIVIPAPGAPARMPFWHGEYGARSMHLSARVGELRRELAAAGHPERSEDSAGGHPELSEDSAGRHPERSEGSAVHALARRYGADEATINSLVAYMAEVRANAGFVPDDRTLLAEQFRDETGAVRLLLHAPFGGRVNAPWGMALSQRYAEALGVEVQVQTTDDGIMLRLSNLDRPAPMELLHGLTPEEATQRITAEVGQSSLFGARFRMNAGRALLLPRGNPRRRMPLWLQRLKSQDLLEAVREFPSFPILVETYRDVLQDAFDLGALRSVLRELGEGRISIRSVMNDAPSPMAASLQFGFVMDWMYADDTPRAERAAAMLSLDTALLEDLLDTPGDLEDNLASALQDVLERRRGTAPERRARTADELALLLDRAGDLTIDELRARVSDVPIGDPVGELLGDERAIGIRIPRSGGSDVRVVLIESLPRYSAAFGHPGTVFLGADLREAQFDSAVPRAFRGASLTQPAAAREILARHLALAGPVTVDELRGRYDFEAAWIEERLAEWTDRKVLVRGRFSLPGFSSALRWCSRRVVEQARRRALAAARREIAAVPFTAFAHFVQRWQRVSVIPSAARDLQDGEAIVRQLYGIPRPPLAWRSEYLAVRIEQPDSALSALSGTGEMLWVGDVPKQDSAAPAFRAVRFLRRGTERAWLRHAERPALSERATKTLEQLRSRGASFFFELLQGTALGSHALRDALHELVAAGLVTNDAIDAMHAVARWRPMFASKREGDPDPARWLPADFVRQRPVVQRRVNVRRLPKWKRPDREGGDAPWPGRWSALDVPAGPLDPAEEADLAETVARQWLDRYGVVARDWWKRERPAVSWRAVYRELRRLEMRGEVRRGYFVEGLAGAQFALPSAVEELRASAASADDTLAVMAASDPANVWWLPSSGDSFARPRGSRQLLVTRRGQVLVTADHRARNVMVREGLDAETVTAAVAALIRHVSSRRARDLVVEQINGSSAATSPYTPAFQRAGLRLTTAGLRYYASFER
jgi:ATP-dependent Lhr-like helicase